MAQNLLGIVLALGLLLPSTALAQRSSPAWSQLTPEQQRILAPIHGEWDKLDAPRKQKWIGVAQRYPRMTSSEQERLQRRMKEWAALSPEQRQAAREKYREFEQLPPEERQSMRAKWEKFQEAQAAKEAEKRAAAEAADAVAPEDDEAGAEAGAEPRDPATESAASTQSQPAQQ